MQPKLRALYICYLSLSDPLARSQVVAYLEGLAARGHTIHLLTFEPKLSAADRRELAADLERRGIAWHSLRYHKRPSLPATIYDSILGALTASRLVRRHGLDAVHARSHVPAAMAIVVRALTGVPFIFDIRGLWAEEYADARRWRRNGIPYRITNRVQRAAIRRAAGIVTLTERVRRHLFGTEAPERAFVIPCCADFDRLARAPEAGAIRELLGLGDRPIMIYVGKLTRPYMERAMVEFFLAARRLDPALVFVVVTQANPETIASEFRRAEIPASDYRITRAAPDEIGAYLAAADFAICFCHPTLSLMAASPTKIGEYLTAGLPVVSGPRVGDVDTLLAERQVGVVLDSFSPSEYEAAARKVRRLAADPEVAERCRQVARDEFSLAEVGIPRYDMLYRSVAEAISG